MPYNYEIAITKIDAAKKAYERGEDITSTLVEVSLILINMMKKEDELDDFYIVSRIYEDLAEKAKFYPVMP